VLDLMQPIIEGKAQIVQGSRILGGGALRGGMPYGRYIANRILSGHRVSRTSLRNFIDTWLAVKKPETAARTHAFYSEAAARLLAFLGDKADGPISDIVKADLVAYRNHLASRVSPRTTNHHLRITKMIFRAARRDSVIGENPAEFFDPVKQPNGGDKRRAFSLDELRAILDVCDPEWRSMVMFGLYTGQRLSDVASLTWANVDLQKNELRLVTRKTGKRLVIPIASPLARHLETLPSSDDPRAPIHPKAHAVMVAHGRTASLSNQFAAILADAGLRPPLSHQSSGKGRHAARELSPLSFHSLRRTATTLLHEAGIPAAVAQALIGHDSADVHDLYVAIGKEALQKATASLPDL
jgi:integrase